MVQNPHANIEDIEILDNVFPFDITKNHIFPKCFILSDEERKQITDVYKTDVDKFPLIKLSDPLCTRYGANLGDFLFIKRNNGEETIFRYVVE